MTDLSAQQQQYVRQLAEQAQVYQPVKDDELLFVWQDGVLVAFAAWRALVDEAELLSIAVTSAQRRQGFGRMLMNQLIEIWQQHGFNRIFLEVRASNIAALQLYQSVGFVPVGRRKNYYPLQQSANGREDAILMQKEITH